eukprot:gene19190-21112_t
MENTQERIFLNDNSDIFESFTGNLKKLLEEVESFSNGRKTEQFDGNLHWRKIDLCFQAISKECTKLAVAYSKPPLPSRQDRKALLQAVLQSADVLRAWFLAFPRSEGKYLLTALKRPINALFEYIGDLVTSVKTEGCSESPQRLHLIGKIWKICESFASIPKDNKSAVLQHLSDSYKLLTDALQEIEQEINDSNDNQFEEDNWTATDKSSLPFCLGLIKTAKGTLKRLINNIKSKGEVSSVASVDELDKIGNSTQTFSSCVDDLVLSMYPPVDRANLLENAKFLAREMKSCVALAGKCHFMDDSDVMSLEFLNKAIEHNLTKLEASLQAL